MGGYDHNLINGSGRCELLPRTASRREEQPQAAPEPNLSESVTSLETELCFQGPWALNISGRSNTAT